MDDGTYLALCALSVIGAVLSMGKATCALYVLGFGVVQAAYWGT